MVTPIRNAAETVAYLKRRLGEPQIACELDSAQLADCIDDAVRLFDRHLMVTKPNLAKGQVDGRCIEITDPTVTGVLSVDFCWPSDTRDVLQMNVFEILSRMAYPPFALGEWYLLRMYYAMFQRIRGSDPQWRYDAEARRLYLDTWSGPFDVFYVTAHHMTAETLLTGSKSKYAADFLAACLAYAQIRLARITGAFGGIPAPAGTITTDAADMREEAQKTLSDLEAYLKKVRGALYTPIMG